MEDKEAKDYYEDLEEKYKKLLNNTKCDDERLKHILKVSDKQGFRLLKVKEEAAEYKNKLENKVNEKTYELTQLISSFNKYVIASKTDRKGIITYASEAFCDISGYSEDELLGQSHNMVRHPDMSKSLFKDMWNTIKSGHQWEGEVKNLCKDGSFYWVKALITPEYDIYNNLIGYSSIRENITDKKKVEELTVSLEKIVEQRTRELKIANEKLKELNDDLENQVLEGVANNIKKEKQLIEQSKMANMGAMIGNIAHQWRQPLNNIAVVASSIQLQQEFNTLNIEKLSSSMELIIDSTDYLSDNINIFRDFLREKKVMKTVILEERVNIAVKIVGLALKDNGIKFIDNVDYTKETKIFMVVGELTEVIINIINNAKDALKDNYTQEPWVKLDMINNEDYLQIIIEDNAGGIPDSVMPKIFDEYFTTKDETIGTGLGLYMSYKIIVESLKGKLYVHNTDQGAKFIIELPLK
ncbi:MAG: PAS domain-containing sensor histidine kinase [Campylobacterota bacterium]|nr:PAS domain-containing sensor histidine kinase [Campylobacterota bacterium]